VIDAMPTEPTALGDRVYVGTARKRFLTIQANSGRLESRWRVAGIPTGRAAVDDRHVYYAALDNVVYAIDRGSGAMRWKQGLRYRPASGPLLAAGAVVVPGYVPAIPAFSARDGGRVGEMTFPGRLLATPPVFTQSRDGALLAIGITGTDDNKLTMTLLGPWVIPVPDVTPLKELPGVVVPPPLPPG
jgi:outer membrane protein assembly factor BamB